MGRAAGEAALCCCAFISRLSSRVLPMIVFDFMLNSLILFFLLHSFYAIYGVNYAGFEIFD